MSDDQDPQAPKHPRGFFNISFAGYISKPPELMQFPGKKPFLQWETTVMTSVMQWPKRIKCKWWGKDLQAGMDSLKMGTLISVTCNDVSVEAWIAKGGKNVGKATGCVSVMVRDIGIMMDAGQVNPLPEADPEPQPQPPAQHEASPQQHGEGWYRRPSRQPAPPQQNTPHSEAVPTADEYDPYA